ncbi:hypothetical protein [Nonomuraea sp. SYSU D8015]|uniref:hypothetical protein n=1 Tax=Nonomuraea sp. SYSU D8015 TaxID=2593644 RepID=UPI001CB6C736|nr:hypothetical protein [Nonomuraea sp. SYSU D8015]
MGRPTDFRFTVTGPDGEPVTGYEVEHEKKMHFIVVSRDLASFQHLHPEMAADGVWSVKLTLGADLLVAGDYAPRAPAGVSRTATVDGHTVTLSGDLVPGRSSKLTLQHGGKVRTVDFTALAGTGAP